MIIGFLFLAALVLGVWACQRQIHRGEVFPSSAVEAPAVVEPDYELWKIKAQEDVRASLKDGGSAEFRAVAIHMKNGAPLVCGQVNAKNSYGGFGGFQRFIYMGSAIGPVLEEGMAAGEMNKAWREFCAG